MKEITASGQTVEDAVQSALEQLNITRDQASIEVIDQGKKGLFGIIGAKPAVVKVFLEEDTASAVDSQTPTDSDIQTETHDIKSDDAIEKQDADPIKSGQAFLQDVIVKMNVTADVTVEVDGKHITYNLEGDSIGMLIGKHGQTLNALQYLLHLVVNKNSDSHYAVVLDAEGYRKRRQASLEALAKKMGDKAVYLQRKVALDPMPAFERKLIHNVLQENNQVSTFSDGQAPHRHVVIIPK